MTKNKMKNTGEYIRVNTIHIVALIALAIIMGALVGSALNQTKLSNIVKDPIQNVNAQPTETTSIFKVNEVGAQVKEVEQQAAPAGGGSCGGACGNPSCGGASGGSCGCGG